MSKFGQVINVDDLPDGGVIPAGTYEATIEKCDFVENKAGNGTLIKVSWKIDGPTMAGAMVFDQINFSHPNEVAQRLGQAQFKRLLIATGTKIIQESEQLIGARCQIRVAVDPAKDGYDERNSVKEYKALGSEVPARPVFGAKKKAEEPAKKGPWAK